MSSERGGPSSWFGVESPADEFPHIPNALMETKTPRYLRYRQGVQGVQGVDFVPHTGKV